LATAEYVTVHNFWVCGLNSLVPLSPTIWLAAVNPLTAFDYLNGIIRDPESGSVYLDLGIGIEKNNNTRDRDWKKNYESGPGGIGIKDSSRFRTLVVRVGRN
jgi:hypothetical protein